MGDVKLLDCTLRDGGYYTNWRFDEDLVKAYMSAMVAAQVERVEIGFRMPLLNAGPFANISDNHVLDLLSDDTPELGVMINAKDVLASPDDCGAFINRFFCEAEESCLTFVRVAAQLGDIDKCADLCRHLSWLGYDVVLNIMQCDDLGKDVGASVASTVAAFGCVKTLYFADSLGAMGPEDVGELVTSAKRAWPGELGFHAHDNQQEAVWNCRAAMENGARWVDGTVCGMGRGAGNASTLPLLMLLGKKTDPLRQLALSHFIPLQKAHGWGYNEHYLTAAEYKVHPTYVQEMIALGCTANAIEKVLTDLRGHGRQYSQEKLANLLSSQIVKDLKKEPV